MRNTQGELERLKKHLEGDLGEMDEEDWQEALNFPIVVAIEASYRLIQLKVLQRTYYTKTLLYKMGRTGDPLCLRGCGMEGSLIHA